MVLGSVVGVLGLAKNEAIVQAGRRCSTKVQPVFFTFKETCQYIFSRKLRAAPATWKAVSLSIQSLRVLFPIRSTPIRICLLRTAFCARVAAER